MRLEGCWSPVTTSGQDDATAKDFSAQIVEAPRAFADRTAISGGIDFAMAQLTRAPFQSNRRTIDVSGDGTNNSGRDVAQASVGGATVGHPVGILRECWSTQCQSR